MADMLKTGLSGLRALQRALDTTAHNIANVSTEGYTRQRVEFQHAPRRRPTATAGSAAASNVAAVRRVYDQFLAQQARSSSGSSLARLDAFASQAERARQPVRRHDQRAERARCRVSPTPSRSFQHAGLDPGAPGAARARANALAERLQDLRHAPARHVGRGQRAPRASKRGEITRSRRASRGSTARSPWPCQQTGQPPNDLLDQRDAAHRPAVGQGGVTVVAEGDATLNVFIGNGQPLVLGTTASQITTTVRIRSIPTRLQLALQTPARHRRHLAQRFRRHARRPAGLAHARCSIRRATSSAASRVAHHRRGECAASRGHGPDRRARRRLLQRRAARGVA